MTTQAEEYGARTAVLEPYFAVIQAGDLQPYFNRNTDRKRLIYSVNTVKYGENTALNRRPGLQRNTIPIRPFTYKIR